MDYMLNAKLQDIEKTVIYYDSLLCMTRSRAFIKVQYDKKTPCSIVTFIINNGNTFQ